MHCYSEGEYDPGQFASFLMLREHGDKEGGSAEERTMRCSNSQDRSFFGLLFSSPTQGRMKWVNR